MGIIDRVARLEARAKAAQIPGREAMITWPGSHVVHKSGPAPHSCDLVIECVSEKAARLTMSILEGVGTELSQ